MNLGRLPITVALAAAIILLVAKDALFGDARWWNLMMAALLLIALGVFLRSRRQGP